MSLRILCAADLHLGRPPSRVPESVRIDSYSTWRALVELAVAEVPDALLLAGDVIDTDHRSFEAWGPLRDGLMRLRDAGIPVVAVAGNHDHAALPQFHRETGGELLHLLGAGGVWERWSLEDASGGSRLSVDGWSFPASHHPSDPTHRYTLERPTGGLHLGLLHCDLDVAQSRYAPVRSAALRQRDPAAWILGHIHAPRLDAEGGGASLLYPGSLQALDPGETGVRGAYRLTQDDRGALTFDRVPLSATRYDEVEIDVTGAADEGDVMERARSGLRTHVDRVVGEGEGRVAMACCRLRVTGRTSSRAGVKRGLRGLDTFDPGGDGPRLIVDGRPLLDVRPALDLRSLASGAGAPAILADLLVKLEAGSPDALESELVGRLERRARGVMRRTQYTDAGVSSEAAADPEALHSLVRRQAEVLLDRLLATEVDA